MSETAVSVCVIVGVVSIHFHSAFWTPPASESAEVIVKYVGYTLLRAEPLKQPLMPESRSFICPNILGDSDAHSSLRPAALSFL